VYALTTGMASLGLRDDLRRRAELAGLETRSPLLDLDLVELVLRLPPELSFDPHLTRPLLRDAVRGAVPDAVRLRPGKSYFDSLIQRALAVEDLGAASALLLDPRAEVRAWVDADRVSGLLSAGPARDPLGPRHWARAVWRLLAAECWLRREADPGWPERGLTQLPLRARRWRWA
jgi:asparagine synthase (glutamine-hydrolysing)